MLYTLDYPYPTPAMNALVVSHAGRIPIPSNTCKDVEISPPNLLTWGEQSYILPLLRGYGFARNFGGTKPGWSLVDRSGFCFGEWLRAVGYELRSACQ